MYLLNKILKMKLSGMKYIRKVSLVDLNNQPSTFLLAYRSIGHSINWSSVD